MQVAFPGPGPSLWLVEGPDKDDPVFLALSKAVGAALATGNPAPFPQGVRDDVLALSPAAYRSMGG